MSGAAFLSLATTTALGILLLGLLLCLIRLLRGPTLSDRILALDTMTILALAFICVIAIKTSVFLYLDIAISIGLVGFLATIAFARYVQQRGRATGATDADTNEEVEDAR